MSKHGNKLQISLELTEEKGDFGYKLSGVITKGKKAIVFESEYFALDDIGVVVQEQFDKLEANVFPDVPGSDASYRPIPKMQAMKAKRVDLSAAPEDDDPEDDDELDDDDSVEESDEPDEDAEEDTDDEEDEVVNLNPHGLVVEQPTDPEEQNVAYHDTYENFGEFDDVRVEQLYRWYTDPTLIDDEQGAHVLVEADTKGYIAYIKSHNQHWNTVVAAFAVGQDIYEIPIQLIKPGA